MIKEGLRPRSSHHNYERMNCEFLSSLCNTLKPNEIRSCMVVRCLPWGPIQPDFLAAEGEAGGGTEEQKWAQNSPSYRPCACSSPTSARYWNVGSTGVILNNWAGTDSDPSTWEEGEEAVKSARKCIVLWAERRGSEGGLVWRGQSKGNRPSAAGRKWALGQGCQKDPGPGAQPNQEIMSML